MPMNDNFTIPLPERKQILVENSGEEQVIAPSRKTLAFIKLFARNYQIESNLPEGLQEIILG